MEAYFLIVATPKKNFAHKTITKHNIINIALQNTTSNATTRSHFSSSQTDHIWSIYVKHLIKAMWACFFLQETSKINQSQAPF